jgi:hypothetical protein
MRRLPFFAFGGLAVATVAAVFITQHLKVTTPLIAGSKGPTPAVLCPHQWTRFSFHPLHRAENVSVYVVNSADRVVRTLVLNVPRARKQDLALSWNGHGANHLRVPPGTYNFRVVLIHQHRTIDPLPNDMTQTPMSVKVKAVC